MKRAFQNFIYYLANTNPQTVKHFLPEHRYIPDLIGMSVLIAGLTSTASIAYFLSSVFEDNSRKYFIIPVGCILYFFTIILLDKGLFLAQTKKALLVRGAIVMGLVSVTSIPFKIALQESKIITVMNNQHKKKQAAASKGLNNLKANARVQEQALQRDLNKLKNEKSRMEQLRQSEDDGLKLNGKSTGVKGQGDMWDKYDKQVKILDNRIKELEQTINNSQDKSTKQITVATENTKLMTPEQDQSFISRYIAYKKILNSQDEEERVAVKEFNNYIYFIFILIELSPVFLKLLLGKSNHIALQMAQDAAFEREGLKIRRAYMVESLRRGAPKVIDPAQITDDDINEGIRQADRLMRKNRDNYGSISGRW